MTQNHTRTWLGAVGALVAVSTFALLHGVLGLLAGIGIILSWYTLPSVYAFAIGQFALTAIAAQGGPRPLQLGFLQAGLVGILVEPAIAEDRQGRLVVIIGLGISISMSVAWSLTEWVQPLWTSVVVLTASLALVTYGLHRYEQLALGLVQEVR